MSLVNQGRFSGYKILKMIIPLGSDLLLKNSTEQGSGGHINQKINLKTVKIT